jgi:hypothetical protein
MISYHYNVKSLRHSGRTTNPSVKQRVLCLTKNLKLITMAPGGNMFVVHTARPLNGPRRYITSIAAAQYIHTHLPEHLGDREVVVVGLRATQYLADELRDQVLAFQRDETLPPPIDTHNLYLVVMELLWGRGANGKLDISQLRVIRPGDRFTLGSRGFYALSAGLPDQIAAESAVATFKDNMVRALLATPGYKVTTENFAPNLRPWARTLVPSAE